MEYITLSSLPSLNALVSHGKTMEILSIVKRQLQIGTTFYFSQLREQNTHAPTDEVERNIFIASDFLSCARLYTHSTQTNEKLWAYLIAIVALKRSGSCDPCDWIKLLYAFKRDFPTLNGKLGAFFDAHTEFYVAQSSVWVIELAA